MLMEPYQINTIVKQLNDSTERAMTPEEEQELLALRAKTTEGRMADNAILASLRELRLKPVDIERRRSLAAEMNVNPMYAGYRFRVMNGRLTAERVL